MKKRFVIYSGPINYDSLLGLLLCGVMFLFGSVAGTVSAGYISDGAALFSDISSYTGAQQTSLSAAGFFQSFFAMSKYHLMAVFLASSVAGVILIPILSALRGFFLSVSIAAFVRLFGLDGILASLFYLGVPVFIGLPCFFLISSRAFLISRSMVADIISSQSSSPRLTRQFLLSFLILSAFSLVLLAFFAFIDHFLLSRFSYLLADKLF